MRQKLLLKSRNVLIVTSCGNHGIKIAYAGVSALLHLTVYIDYEKIYIAYVPRFVHVIFTAPQKKGGPNAMSIQ